MTRIEDIKDQQSLRVWLEEQDSYEVSVTIAARAALRVQPWIWACVAPARPGAELTALPFFWPNLIVAVKSMSPNAELRNRAAGRAVDAVGSAATTAAGSASEVAAANANPASHAAEVAADVAASPSAHAATAAHATATAAIASADATDVAGVSRAGRSHLAASARLAFWDEVRRDARLVIEGTGKAWKQLLWLKPPERFAKDWATTHAAWQAAGTPWDDFARIYNDFWEGREPDWPYLEQIVLIDPMDWNAGPGAVAEAIAKIGAARAEAQDSTSAEFMRAALGDFRFDQASALLHIIPFEEDNQHLSGEALARFLNDA